MSDMKISDLAKLLEKNIKESTTADPYNTKIVELGTVGKKKIVLNIKKYLSFQEFGQKIRSLMNISFDENGYTSDFDILLPILICDAYSSFKLDGNDAEEYYSLIMELGLYDEVYDFISGTTQFNDLRNAVNELRKYEMTANTGIGALIKVIKQVIEGLDVDSLVETLKGFSPEQ